MVIRLLAAVIQFCVTCRSGGISPYAERLECGLVELDGITRSTFVGIILTVCSACDAQRREVDLTLRSVSGERFHLLFRLGINTLRMTSNVLSNLLRSPRMAKFINLKKSR